VNVREVMNGLMYVLSTGCQWRAIPKDLPPRSTVNHYFCRWQDDGTLDRLHHALYVLCRERADRAASPTAAIIDSQSVKSAEKATVLAGKRRFDFSRSDMDRVAFVGFGLGPLRSMAVGRLIGWTPSFTRIAMGSSSG
jgi:transposase